MTEASMNGTNLYVDQFPLDTNQQNRRQIHRRGLLKQKRVLSRYRTKHLRYQKLGCNDLDFLVLSKNALLHSAYTKRLHLLFRRLPQSVCLLAHYEVKNHDQSVGRLF